MTLSLRAGFALLATTAVLAGCSTAPTITVPNPLAALNSAFTPAPRVAPPAYTAAPATYQQVAPGYTVAAPSYGTASYGTVGQSYSVPSVDTGVYGAGSIAPSYTTGIATLEAPAYSAAPSLDQGSYTLGGTAPATSYSASVPTLGTLASPSYAASAPVVESATYASQVTTFGAPVTTTRSYAAATEVQGYTGLSPVQASGTTYDLTVPSAGGGIDPAAGLTIDSGYGTLSAPEPAMGGSFQVVPPTVSGGVATYSSGSVPVEGGTFTY